MAVHYPLSPSHGFPSVHSSNSGAESQQDITLLLERPQTEGSTVFETVSALSGETIAEVKLRLRGNKPWFTSTHCLVSRCPTAASYCTKLYRMFDRNFSTFCGGRSGIDLWLCQCHHPHVASLSVAGLKWDMPELWDISQTRADARFTPCPVLSSVLCCTEQSKTQCCQDRNRPHCINNSPMLYSCSHSSQA